MLRQPGLERERMVHETDQAQALRVGGKAFVEGRQRKSVDHGDAACGQACQRDGRRGARNVVGKASTDDAGAAGPALSETSARTPYVRYKQDL